MSFEVTIIRNSDGEQATYIENGDWSEFAEFRWTEGNESCDCNRAALFALARGEETEHAVDLPCGDNKYSVILPPTP